VARYVCDECGRKVCAVCLESRSWVCSECCNRNSQEAPTSKVSEVSLWATTPFRLFVLGFSLIVTGMILMTIVIVFLGASPFGAGAVIFIGPIPIVLGAGLYSGLAVILAMALTLVGLMLFFVLRKRRSEPG
jgi:uncharacterized membrane protein